MADRDKSSQHFQAKIFEHLNRFDDFSNRAKHIAMFVLDAITQEQIYFTSREMIYHHHDNRFAELDTWAPIKKDLIFVPLPFGGTIKNIQQVLTAPPKKGYLFENFQTALSEAVKRKKHRLRISQTISSIIYGSIIAYPLTLLVTMGLNTEMTTMLMVGGMALFFTYFGVDLCVTNLLNNKEEKSQLNLVEMLKTHTHQITNTASLFSNRLTQREKNVYLYQKNSKEFYETHNQLRFKDTIPGNPEVMIEDTRTLLSDGLMDMNPFLYIEQPKEDEKDVDYIQIQAPDVLKFG